MLCRRRRARTLPSTYLRGDRSMSRANNSRSKTALNGHLFLSPSRLDPFRQAEDERSFSAHLAEAIQMDVTFSPSSSYCFPPPIRRAVFACWSRGSSYRVMPLHERGEAPDGLTTTNQNMAPRERKHRLGCRSVT